MTDLRPRGRGARGLVGWGALAAALLGSPAVAGAATVDRVAAIVNDDVITLSEVYEIGSEYIAQRCPLMTGDACLAEAEIEVLDSLVLRALMRQELIRLGLDVTPEEIERTLDSVMRDNRIEDRAAFRSAIEAQGVSWDAYRDELTEQVRQMKFNEAVVRPRVTVSEEEALDRYKRSVRDFEAPSVFELGALALRIPKDQGAEGLINTVAEARRIAAEVNGGTLSWADALAQYDSGVFAQKPEGYLGRFKKGEALPEIEKAALSVKVGQVSEPVKVGDSVFLIKLLAFQASDVRSFEDARAAIMDRLYEEKIELEIERWYQQTKRQASIKTLLSAP